MDIDPVNIDELFMNEISICPNPAKHVLNIYLGTSPEIEDGMIILINIHGKVISSVKITEGSKNIRINTSDYVPGLYYAKIVEYDRVIGVRKAVIAK